MNPVVHFEMPYDNRERMAKFYGSAFGWRTQMLGEDMGNYVLATTTETDATAPTVNGILPVRGRRWVAPEGLSFAAVRTGAARPL
jgi:predicted enzyme related to lactoylglutathione lyase